MTRQPSSIESIVFAAIARFVLRHRLLVVAGSLALAVGCALAARARLSLDMTIEAFLDEDSPALVALEAYRDQFGRDDGFLLIVEGPVFSKPYLRRLRALHEKLAALDVEVETLNQSLLERRRASNGSAARRGPGRAERKVSKSGGRGKSDDADFSGFEIDTEGEGDSSSSGSSSGASWGDEARGTIVDEITSLINVRRTVGYPITRADGSKGYGLSVSGFLDAPPTAADLPRLRREALADPLIGGQFVSRDAQLSLIVLRTQRMSAADSERVYRAIEKIADQAEAPGFQIHLSGFAVLASALNELILGEMRRLFAVAVLVLVLMMLISFRHPVGVIAPLAVVMLSIALTFGVMAVGRMDITLLTNILPTFLFCVGVGDSVHILSVYRDLRAGGIDNDEAIVSAVASTGKPVLFTSLTTAFGLLSFQFATVGAIRNMGLAGCAGVLGALLFTLLLVPVVLSFNRRGVLGGGRESRMARWLDRLLDVSASASGPGLLGEVPAAVARRRRRITLALFAVVTLASGAAITRLQVWHDPISWLQPDEPVRVAFDKMDDHLGGTATLQVMLRAKGPRGVKDLELLRGLEKVEQHLKRYRDPTRGEAIVGSSVGLLDIVKETYRALNGGDPRYYRLPDTQGALDDTMFLFTQSAPDRLRRVVSTDMKTMQMTLRVHWLDATSYGPLVAYLNRGIEKYIGDRAEVTTTGAVHTLLSTVSSLLFNVLRSFGVAFVVITVLMVLMLGELRLALVAMVPNLLPIAIIAALMGLLGIPIDMANLLIASIALGIAVDDTIHFLHHFRAHFIRHGDREQAIRYSFRHSGRALVTTSAILAAGFAVFAVSRVVSLQRFGALIATTVVIALAIDLVFTPALLRTMRRFGPK